MVAMRAGPMKTMQMTMLMAREIFMMIGWGQIQMKGWMWDQGL